MFKKSILVLLQTLLFLVLLTAGALMPALPAFRSLDWQVQTAPNRVYVMDGLLLTLAGYLLILAVEALRKHLRGAGAMTTLALVLALVLGMAMKIGFKSV